MADVPNAGYPIPTATAIVVDGYNRYTSIGDEWAEKAELSLAAIDDFTIEPVPFGVSFNIDDWVGTFERPSKPADPVLPTITVDDVAMPALDPIALRLLGEAPEEPDLTGLLAYAPPSIPATAAPVPPSDTTPALDPIVVPEMPEYTLPEAPTLYELDLPDVPTVEIPAFDGVRPSFDIDLPMDGALAWTEERYVSELQDALAEKVSDMLQGTLGLPLAVEQALFDRGRAREDRASRKLIMEVTEDMAARNMTEPNGILGKRLQQAREANRDKTGELNREITIKTAEMAVENVKFAVTQGLALEQIRVQMNMAINERALRASLAVLDYGVQRFNAQVSLANLDQQAYATDAQVWRDRIQGALATLEVYKAEIEGQRLVGDINKSLVERYEAQHRAVLVLADIYKSDVEAAKARGEINVQRIEAARLILQKYGHEVDAWGKGWEGYKAQVEASMGTARFAEVLASIYATRMQGYRTKGEAFFQEGQIQIARNGQSLDVLRGRLQISDMNLRGQTAALDAALREYTAKAGMYEAEGSVVQAEAAAADRLTSLRLEAERSRTDVALQNARIALDQAIKIAELQLEALKGKAGVYGQLASSSQSAVSLGANISGSGSLSDSRSLSWNYSGEAADWEESPPILY